METIKNTLIKGLSVCTLIGLLAACSDGGSTVSDGTADCQYLADKQFISLEELKIEPQGSLVREFRRLQFNGDQFEWIYSDFSEAGMVECDGENIVAYRQADITQLIALEVFSDNNQIIFDGKVYRLDEDTSADVAENRLYSLDHSLMLWLEQKQANGANYQYSTWFSSWIGFNRETSFVIRADVIVERHETSWSINDERSSWSETTAEELGTHAGDPLRLVGELYQVCKQEVLVVDEEQNYITLMFDDTGILKVCTFFPKNCADDCAQGVNIYSLDF